MVLLNMALICPVCGLTYTNFRTGLDYSAVYAMMWSALEDPQYWRNKSKHGVLGYWREIKKRMWAEHLEWCKPSDITEDYSGFTEY